jgi:hypothetical protein
MWNILIPALTTLAAMYFGGGKSGDPSAQQANLMTPEMREMLQIQLSRLRGQEPLYNDVMGMARGMLPTRYRGSMPRPPAPMTDNPGPGILGNKPGGNRTGPGGGAGQPDHTDPYNGWQPPRI